MRIKVKGLDRISYNERKMKREQRVAVQDSLADSLRLSKQTKLFQDVTGLLRRSTVEKITQASGNIIGILRNTAPYAAFIHDGTKHISKRPWLLKSVESKVPELGEDLADATVKSFINKRGFKR